ncbi:unnamed protein product [Meganyctiphanes norvegica]|uniref:Uncharacterized protein n=1 Tax=Meganyctiphanes norvegica TaxID=48144 RepID=A0AAV2RW27_MEGNR
MRRSNEWYKLHLEVETFYGIKTHANVNVQDMHGQAALYRAAYRGHIDVVKKLLEHPDIDPNVTTQDGITAIYAAAAKGNTDCVRLLLEHPNTNPNMQKSDGASAIYTATFNGRIEILELLLNHPWTNPNLRKNNGSTALYCAAEKGWTQCMELLLENMRLDPNIAMQPGNDTPLTIASSKGHRDIVLQLIDNPRIDVNHQNDNGDNALIMAADKGDMNIIRALLEHPAIDVNACNESGMTPLMFACWKGMAAMADMLLKAGADWQLNNDKGNTAEAVSWLNKHHAIQALIKTKVKDPKWFELDQRNRMNIQWYTASIYGNSQELQSILNQDGFLSVSSEILDRAHKAAAWAGDSDTEHICRSACARKEKNPRGQINSSKNKDKSTPSPQKRNTVRVEEPTPVLEKEVAPEPLNFASYPGLQANRHNHNQHSQWIQISPSVEERPDQQQEEIQSNQESPSQERRSSAKKFSMMMMNEEAPKTKTDKVMSHHPALTVVPETNVISEPKIIPMDMSSLENAVAEIVLKRQKEKQAQNAESGEHQSVKRKSSKALMGFMSSMYDQDENNNS